MIPSTIIAGDTLSFSTTVADYPASDGWTLTHVLIPRASGGDSATFAATADGDDYASTVAAATTADWVAGTYSWAAYVSKAGERYTVGRGTLTVLADPAEAEGGYDPRSNAAKIVDAIDAMLAGRATLDQQEYEIAVGGSSRRLRYCTRTELIEMRDYYASIVRAEDAALTGGQGRASKRRIFVRFGQS